MPTRDFLRQLLSKELRRRLQDVDLNDPKGVLRWIERHAREVVGNPTFDPLLKLLNDAGVIIEPREGLMATLHVRQALIATGMDRAGVARYLDVTPETIEQLLSGELDVSRTSTTLRAKLVALIVATAPRYETGMRRALSVDAPGGAGGAARTTEPAAQTQVPPQAAPPEPDPFRSATSVGPSGDTRRPDASAAGTSTGGPVATEAGTRSGVRRVTLRAPVSGDVAVPAGWTVDLAEGDSGGTSLCSDDFGRMYVVENSALKAGLRVLGRVVALHPPLGE